ncbi:MAG: DUF1444 family protein [Clostridia bacterium]|nr:DUF1444 family protein [Clostridia bacterium]
MRHIKRMGLFLAMILTAGACLGAAAQGAEPMDQADFTRRVGLLLQEAMPGASVTQVEADVIEVRLADQEESGQIWTNNMYGEYLAAPDELERLLAHYVQAYSDIIMGPPEEELNAQNIVPVLRPVTYLEVFDEEALQHCAYDAWTPSLVVLYVFDFPTTVRNVTSSDLEELGIERAALRELACQNLARLSEGVTWLEEEGRYWAALDGMYESSLLLLPMWDAEAFPAIKGELRVAVPQRGDLVVFGSEDAEMTVAVLMYLRENFENLPYAVLNGLLRWNGAAFEELHAASAGE